MPNLGQATRIFVAITNGTYVHANVTTEEDVTEVLVNVDKIEIAYDVSLLTQNTTIRVFEKVDGTIYEQVNEVEYPTDFDTADKVVVIELAGKGRDQKVTFQSLVLEGATRDIPFTSRNEVAN